MTQGLNLVSSNQVETLLKILGQELMEKPLSSPFLEETIVVPSPAMARWVNLNLARQNTIATNIEYPLPAVWIWDIAYCLIDDLPDRDPLTPETSAWKIFFLIPNLVEREEFHPVAHYLTDDPDSIKRWLLSVKIARLFDRYQFYRPDLIRDWCRGKDNHWQSVLWRELLKTVQQRHRIDVIDEMLSVLSRRGRLAQLPERISLFALSSLPPLFVDVIHALSTKTQVSLFIHSPSEHYWADISSKKTISRLRVRSPNKADYYENGNELLASWGRQGQALQDLLLNHESIQSVSTEIYKEPLADSLLHQIQKGIIGLENEVMRATVDPSVQIHICHSPFRECQVLHDQLLGILQADPALRPEDILVMIPDINHYAPYIEAVFAKTETGIRPFIPWNLSDICISEEHPLIEIFFQLLRLPDSRFTTSEVFSYLDIPELINRFKLDSGASETLRSLIQSANVRWGIDARHKDELDLPQFQENTWQQAECRFFAGYAIGTHNYWNGIAPIGEIEGEKAVIVGRFWHFLQSLIDTRKQLRSERSGPQWQEFLNELMDRFFNEDVTDSEQIQHIRDAIEPLQHLSKAETLSRELLLHWLQKTLADKISAGRYFSGGVSFCGMRPMRSLPFQVICLLGMNDQVFPRREQSIEFDLMKQSWKPGDPNNGDEDRYLLLETLLCTRKILYISYTGRDLRDNTPRQPSVLVQELSDFIDQLTSEEPSITPKTSDCITTIHPMQAFSPKNFTVKLPAYDKHWARIAKTLSSPPSTQSENPWPTIQVPPPVDETRTFKLSRLHQFLKHPVASFFKSRLKIRLEDQALIEDSEPFSPNALERWQVKSISTEHFLECKSLDKDELSARGEIPHGSLGPAYLEELNEETRPIFNQLEEYKDRVPEFHSIALSFEDGFSLNGRIAQVYPGKGLLHFTPSKSKGARLLALWLDHLCLCAANVYKDNQYSRLICLDKASKFPPLDPVYAHRIVWGYLALYREGLRRPLPIFPEASQAWTKHWINEKSAQARAQAIQKWDGYPYRNIPGEKDDPYIQLALRRVSQNPIDSPEFARLSEKFFQEALACAEPL